MQLLYNICGFNKVSRR